MRLNLTKLMDALNKLKYDFSSYEGESAGDIEISIVEEDIHNGQMVSCLVIKAENVKPASQYRKETNVARVLEIYGNNELPPKLTKAETTTLD